MPSGERDRLLLAAVGVVALWVVYSVVVLQQLLAGVGLVLPLVVIYLLWRLVRATERIADAVEEDGLDPGRSAEGGSVGGSEPNGTDVAD